MTDVFVVIISQQAVVGSDMSPSETDGRQSGEELETDDTKDDVENHVLVVVKVSFSLLHVLIAFCSVEMPASFPDEEIFSPLLIGFEGDTECNFKNERDTKEEEELRARGRVRPAGTKGGSVYQSIESEKNSNVWRHAVPRITQADYVPQLCIFWL